MMEKPRRENPEDLQEETAREEDVVQEETLIGNDPETAREVAAKVAAEMARETAETEEDKMMANTETETTEEKVEEDKTMTENTEVTVAEEKREDLKAPREEMVVIEIEEPKIVVTMTTMAETIKETTVEEEETMRDLQEMM